MPAGLTVTARGCHDFEAKITSNWAGIPSSERPKKKEKARRKREREEGGKKRKRKRKEEGREEERQLRALGCASSNSYYGNKVLFLLCQL